MATLSSINHSLPQVAPDQNISMSDWLMIGSALSSASAVAVVALALTGRVSFTKPFGTSVISALVLGILGAIYKEQKIDITPFLTAASSYMSSYSYLREGSTFEVDDKKYYIAYTLGDGACGMHAFFGTKATPTSYYSYPEANVRGYYTDALRAQMSEPSIKQKWEEWMVHFITDYVTNPYGFYTSMVFGPLDKSSLNGDLKALDERGLTLNRERKALLGQAIIDPTARPLIMEELDRLIVEEEQYLPEQEREAHTRDLRHRLQEDAFACSRMLGGLDSIIPLIKHLEIGRNIEKNFADIKALDGERTAIFERFVCQEAVLEAYIKGVSLSYYYFSTQELGLMAHLFKKRIQVYHEIRGVPTLELDEGDKGLDPVVVFHQGIHFSRCEPRSE